MKTLLNIIILALIMYVASDVTHFFINGFSYLKPFKATSNADTIYIDKSLKAVFDSLDNVYKGSYIGDYSKWVLYKDNKSTGIKVYSVISDTRYETVFYLLIMYYKSKGKGYKPEYKNS